MSDRAAARARPAPAAQSWWVAGWMALCGGIAAAGAYYAVTKVIDHDVGYWLDAAGRMLDGARLYRDIIELNPPVNYLLSLLPVALARLLGADPIWVYHGLVAAGAVGAAAVSARLLQRLFDGDRLLAQLMVPPILIAFLLLPGSDFGQREHLLAMALLPYLVIAAGAPTLRLALPARLAAGAAAGLVVSFKPYFLLYLVVPELVVVWRARDLRAAWRVELLTALAIIATAAAATVVLFPEYLGFIVPLGRAIYQGFEQPLLAILTRPHCASALLLVSGLAVAGSHRAARRVRPLLQMLGAATAAAIAIYLMQHKGWRYHALPILVFATVALGTALAAILAAELAKADRRRAARTLAVAGLATALVSGVLLGDRVVDDRRHAADVRPLVELVAREAAGRPVLFLSTHLPEAFPVVNYTGALWPYRYHHMLPLPALYEDFDQHRAQRPFRRPAEMGPVEAQFFATVVSDAVRFPPQLMLVDRRPQYGRLDVIGFDFLGYFRQAPEFAALLAQYRPLRTIYEHDVWARRE